MPERSDEPTGTTPRTEDESDDFRWRTWGGIFAVTFGLMGLGELLGHPSWLGYVTISWLGIITVVAGSSALKALANWNERTPPYNGEGDDDR